MVKNFTFGEGSTKYSLLYCSIECRDKMFSEKKQYIKNDKNDVPENTKRPSADVLINDYKELGSFRKIGEKYGVSDKSIQKWFVKYNLPSNVKEIRTYIIDTYGPQPQWYDYRYDENGNRKGMTYKKIDVYTIDNVFIKTYDSINELMNDLKLNTSGWVREVCIGRKESYCGYKFKYHED